MAAAGPPEPWSDRRGPQPATGVPCRARPDLAPSAAKPPFRRRPNGAKIARDLPPRRTSLGPPVTQPFAGAARGDARDGAGSRPRLSARPGVRRAALTVAVLLAVGAAHLAGNDAASARPAAADPELARLLRSMALIKAAMAAAAVWLADRLLRLPLGTGLAAGIVLAVAAWPRRRS